MTLQPKENVKFAPNDERLLEESGFKVGAPLNSGRFACVYKATYNDIPLAVKVIDLEKNSKKYLLHCMFREIDAMKKLQHYYLIEILDIFTVGNRVLVFMELAEGGNILDMLQETKALSEDKARYFYRQFGDALRYMHSMGYAHGDIKCADILLNKARTVSMLSDFTFTRSVIDPDTGKPKISELLTYEVTCRCTAEYAAPEVIRAKPFNAIISDVWSIGVVLFVLTQDRLPFGERDAGKLLASQLERNYKLVKSVSKQCKNLINAHLDPDVTKRPSMELVFQHEWFEVDKPEEQED